MIIYPRKDAKIRILLLHFYNTIMEKKKVDISDAKSKYTDFDFTYPSSISSLAIKLLSIAYSLIV